MTKIVKTMCVMILAGLLSSCSVEKEKMTGKEPKSYSVKKINSEMAIDANWDKPQWQAVDPVKLGFYMGEKPEHTPAVEAKMAYDDENVYIIFRVEDNYIKATALEYQDAVCIDSCVEFFFTPNDDVTTGYMNMETNCCGKILLFFQKERGTGIIKVADEHLDEIEIAHSLPQDTITEEIQTPTTWTLEYSIPVSMIEKYMPVQKPASGVVWKGNFYKCADLTSKPHWLTWSFVDKPNPDFHRPDFFGTLTFE